MRKGKIHQYLKQYHKALQTYKEGLKLAADNSDLLEGLREVRTAIAMQNASEIDPERQKRAMEDPDIQRVLTDPTMQTVLQSMKENPASAQKYLSDPAIMDKIELLIAAGVLQTR
jgi:stress-induced-phosphoprotein 1